jgi:DNA-binding NarL/FixJ family response regulator
VTTTVLIADDQQLMRWALRACLEGEPDLQVVGEAVDGAAAVRMARQLRPDVVLMDVRMPVMDGIEATHQITAGNGGRPTRVLVLTTFDLDEHIIDALRAGASGFLVKDSAPEEVVRAVRVIAAGEAVLAPSVTRRLLDLRAATLPPVSYSRDRALSDLTAREREVLKMVARGLSNAQIAAAMGIAPSSVKTHIGHLLAKLHFNDRVQLVVFAYEHELVHPWERHEHPVSPDP